MSGTTTPTPRAVGALPVATTLPTGTEVVTLVPDNTVAGGKAARRTPTGTLTAAAETAAANAASSATSALGVATSAQSTADLALAQVSTAIPLAQKGEPGGVAPLGTDGKVPSALLPAGSATVDQVARDAAAAAIPLDQKGAVNGVAILGADGKVPTTQLPPIVGTGTNATVDQVVAAAVATGQSLPDAIAEMRSKKAGSTAGSIVARPIITASFALDRSHNGGLHVITGAGITINVVIDNVQNVTPDDAEGFVAEFWNKSNTPVALTGQIIAANVSTGVLSIPARQFFSIGYRDATFYARLSGGAAAAGTTPTIGVTAPTGVQPGTSYGTSGTLSGYTTDPALVAVVDGTTVSTGVTFTLTGPSGARTGFTVTGLPALSTGTHTLLVQDSAGTPVQSNGGVAVSFAVATVLTAPTVAPTITGISGNSSSLTLTLGAVSGATDYILQYKPATSATWITRSPAPSVGSVTISGLSPATVYDIHAAASNSAGTGPFSATVQGNTTAGTSAPLLGTLSSAPGVALALHQVDSGFAEWVVTLRRSTDNTEQTFGFVDGVLDEAAILTWKGGGNAFVTKYKSQDAARRQFVQTVATAQPQIANASGMMRHTGSNNRVGIFFDAATATCLNYQTGLDMGGLSTAHFLFDFTSVGTGTGRVMSLHTGSTAITYASLTEAIVGQMQGAGTTLRGYRNNLQLSISTNPPNLSTGAHVASSRWLGTTHVLRVDGVAYPAVAQTGAFRVGATSGLIIGGTNGGGADHTGFITEAYYFPTLSDADNASVESALRTWFGH